MNNLFFSFDNFEKEITKKRNCLEMNPVDLYDKLIIKDKKVKRKLDKLFDLLVKLPFNNIYKGYLTHPIRLCDSLKYFNQKISYEDYSFALCHNLKENGYLDYVFNKKLISKKVKLKIICMTVDRKQILNEIYVKFFYKRMISFSRNLFVFKTFDKLDNLLLFNSKVMNNVNLNLIKKNIIYNKAFNFPLCKRYLNNLIGLKAHKKIFKV